MSKFGSFSIIVLRQENGTGMGKKKPTTQALRERKRRTRKGKDMAEKLTYGKLYDKLKELGFSQRSMQWNGTAVWDFQHREVERAVIFLPPKPADEPVHPSHIGTVRATLKAHGLMDENALSVI